MSYELLKSKYHLEYKFFEFSNELTYKMEFLIKVQISWYKSKRDCLQIKLSIFYNSKWLEINKIQKYIILYIKCEK